MNLFKRKCKIMSLNAFDILKKNKRKWLESDNSFTSRANKSLRNKAKNNKQI